MENKGEQLKKLFFIIALLSSFAYGQGTGTRIRSGASLPSACSPSTENLFYLTTTSGSNQPGIYECTATNTWVGHVRSLNPGAGIAHFAGSTQAVTSSAVDVSSADITGTLKAAAEPAHTGDVTNSAGSLALTIAAGAVTRADLAADAVGWQFECTSSNSATSTVTCTPTTARKHYMCRLIITSYAGGGGVARAEFGNTTTVDTGTNYAFGGFNIVSGTSTAPTVSGIGSGSTAQEGVPVSGSTTTVGRFVQLQISNAGAQIKYFTIETSGIGASAAVTPNLAHIAGTWNNTTNGIGVIQFKGCSATTGTCSTINFTSTVTCWGRDDN